MPVMRQFSLKIAVSGAVIFMLLVVLSCMPHFNKTAWAGSFISLEVAVAFAKENDDAYHALKETYTLKKQAFLDAWEAGTYAAEPPSDTTTLLLSETVEAGMRLPKLARDYLDAEALFNAEKHRIIFEIEPVYLQTMLAQQHLTVMEARLKQREVHLGDVRLKQSYGIASEKETGEVEEAWQKAKEEVHAAEESFHSAMEKLGAKIGVSLDDTSFVQRELLYEPLHGKLCGELLMLALEADGDMAQARHDTKLAYVKKDLTTTFFEQELGSTETTILEAICLPGGDEAEFAAQWESWLWLKEQEGENTAIFDDFRYSLPYVCHRAKQVEHKEVELKLDVIFRMQVAFARVLENQESIIQEEERLFRSQESYNFALAKHRFGIIGYTELIEREDELTEIKGRYQDTVFAGQEILSYFNDQANGALVDYYKIKDEASSVWEQALQVITACPESSLREENPNTLKLAFQHTFERFEDGYAVALKLEEMEIAASLAQLLAATNEKLRCLTIEALLIKQTPAEAKETAERIRSLEREKYSQDELLALHDTGEELNTGLRSLQPLPVESVLAPTHVIKLKVPPVLYRGRIYVSPDIFATLLRGHYEVAKEVTGEGLSDLLVMISRDTLITWDDVGNTVMYLNGRSVDLELHPLKIGEYLLLPLRPLGERLGLQVQWHGELGITQVAGS